MKKSLLIALLVLTAFTAFAKHKHHRKYNFNTSHKGEHHFKNQSSYHAEKYKYRKHRK